MGVNEARYRAAERRLWDSVGVAPTEHRLHLKRTGAMIRIQELGEGPPVVFVHGASNSGTSWAPLVARLEGFRCVLIDRPGCGLSEPLAYKLDDVDRLGAFGDALIVDVLDALELERAHVIGTSFGGYFALRTAAAHPDRVDRTMTFSWSVGAPMSKAPFVMRLTAVPGLGKLATSMPPSARVVRMIFRQIGLGQALDAGRISQEALDWFLALLRDTRSLRNELDSLPPLFSFFGGMNESLLLPDSLLASIRTPTYFLWGDADPNRGADVARAFVPRIPGAELELMPGVGHAPWMDDPDHVAKVATRFLNG